MKKFISFFLLSSIFLFSWAQIPDPEYIPSVYQENTIQNASDTVVDEQPKLFYLQPKLHLGFGNFNFRGDISDNRTSGLIGQSGFQIGLSANLNDQVDAILQMEEGVLRVDGITRDDSPKNFKSTINTFGLRFNYHLNSHKSKKLFNPFIGLGLSYLRFDSKGSDDESNDQYEIDLLSEWLSDPNNDEAYSQTGIDIPITVGFQLKLNERLNVSLGSTYHITNTDFIDNIEDGSSDRYFVNTAFLTYDIFCKNCDDYQDYIPQELDDYNINFELLDKEDEDGDGIPDIDDSCIGTPSNVKVDAIGCPVDTDKDAVPDYLDMEANTPLGAVVNSKGVQLTDEMSEAIYLDYLNATSRKDAASYFEETYPAEKFIKISKEVVNLDGDTLLVDLYKPIVFEQIYDQQQSIEESITPAQFIDLNSKVYYKIQIAKHSKGIDAAEINRLMSISNLKSTRENEATVYYSGEYEDLLKANQRRMQLISSGYSNISIVEDKQGDLRTVTNKEISNEKSARASEKLEELPPMQDIIFRVQLDVLREVDLDFYELDDILVFEGNDGLKRIFTDGFSSYEDALVRRNELYYMSYENAKVVAIENGQLVDADQYMDIQQSVEASADYGDIIYKVQVGIYSKDEVVEIVKVSEIEGIEKTEIADGIFKFTSGYFSNIQAAMIRLNKLTKMGYEGCYPIAFYQNKEISIKKAQELLGY